MARKRESSFPSRTYSLDVKDRNKIITSSQIAALNTEFHMMVGKCWPRGDDTVSPLVIRRRAGGGAGGPGDRLEFCGLSSRRSAPSGARSAPPPRATATDGVIGGAQRPAGARSAPATRSPTEVPRGR
jgi:hypothetical protein